jgi:maleate isomerase
MVTPYVKPMTRLVADYIEDAGVALVISACVQMPSLGVIESVEAESRLPTLSASAATSWGLLRALGLEAPVPGMGSLLAAARAATE